MQFPVKHIGVNKISVHLAARLRLVVGERSFSCITWHSDFSIFFPYCSIGINAVYIESYRCLILGHVAKIPVYLDVVGDIHILAEVQRYHRHGVGHNNGCIDISEWLWVAGNIQRSPRILELEHLIAIILVVVQSIHFFVDEIIIGR